MAMIVVCVLRCKFVPALAVRLKGVCNTGIASLDVDSVRNRFTVAGIWIDTLGISAHMINLFTVRYRTNHLLIDESMCLVTLSSTILYESVSAAEWSGPVPASGFGINLIGGFPPFGCGGVIFENDIRVAVPPKARPMLFAESIARLDD
jgi:hypothetical protein